MSVASVNVGESVETALAFRARHGLVLPLLRDPEGREWRRVARGLPANLIWTRDGRQVVSGPHDDEAWHKRFQELGCPINATP